MRLEAQAVGCLHSHGIQGGVAFLARLERPGGSPPPGPLPGGEGEEEVSGDLRIGGIKVK